MAHMDIFNQDAFSALTLTQAFQDLPYAPTRLGSLGLFDPRPINTRGFDIEYQAGKLELIEFSDPDAPVTAGTQDNARKLVSASTRHFSKKRALRASEVAGIRAFGTESELESAMSVVTQRAMRLRKEVEATFEYHRFNALQGLVKTVAGATIYNWYTQFSITPASTAFFDLSAASPATGALRKVCEQIRIDFEDALDGNIEDGFEIEAICDPVFWKNLTSHKEVLDAYKYAQNIAGQRNLEVTDFFWGGITFRRYRGGSGIALGENTCRLYARVDGMFEHVSSPMENMEFVNTPGLETYYYMLPDPSGRDRFIEAHAEANPMFVCTRPAALRAGSGAAS